jgi:hypothetical protein
MVAITCDARLLDTDMEEETMGADTNDDIIRRENNTINVDIASLRRWSATSLQT